MMKRRMKRPCRRRKETVCRVRYHKGRPASLLPSVGCGDSPEAHWGGHSPGDTEEEKDVRGGGRRGEEMKGTNTRMGE